MYYKNLTRGNQFTSRLFRDSRRGRARGESMNRGRRSSATVAALVLVFHRAGAVRAQERPALDTVAVERALRDELQRTRTPGASIAIVMDGRVVYAKAIGVSNVETGDAMTTVTLVRIGSI